MAPARLQYTVALMGSSSTDRSTSARLAVHVRSAMRLMLGSMVPVPRFAAVRLRSRAGWGLATAMLAAMLPALAAGQTVRGRLLESGSGDPIVLGTVALLDTTMALIEETFTNEDGNFILEAPRPGSYLVLADRLGYQRKVDGIIDLGEGGRISIDFYLKPQPIVLDSMTVEADRRRIERRLADAGFYDRQQAGVGWFIGPDEIDRRPIMTTRDLFRTAPRLWIVEGFPGQSIVMRTNRGEPCTPQLYVDGGRIATVSSGTGVQLDEVVNVEEITGVEVYDGGADTPLLYGGTQNGCGVLVVWTKGGR